MSCACFLLACVCALLSGGEPPREPQLVLETGFHTAMIRRIDVAAGGTVLTVSLDKTARLWQREGKGFRLERVLRVPRGPGHEGKLFAGALSGEGQWVAVGGYTGGDWFGQCFVYVFERATGRLCARLGPLPNLILHLRWRADGALAVCLGSGGLRVFRWPGGHLLWQDADYGGQSYGACWLPDGGLVTTCWDGFVRRYARDGRLLAKARTRAGQQPFAVAHDGAGTLAVGFVDNTAVARYRAQDLAELPPLDTAGVDKGDLGSVAWASGQWWAAGRYDVDGESPILTWTDAGRRACPGPKDTVMDLLPAPGGGLLVGAADPQ
ncbi:MAG: hypothetical protein NZ552_01535, partial [Planctomycetes bacterium]|nr:hypothetical protein [Planctomycetota bacterium]